MQTKHESPAPALTVQNADINGNVGFNTVKNSAATEGFKLSQSVNTGYDTGFMPPELIQFTEQLRDIRLWFYEYWQKLKDRGDHSEDCLDFFIGDVEDPIDEIVRCISKVMVFEFRNFYFYSYRNELIDYPKSKTIGNKFNIEKEV